jgi:hypothetical protein
MSRRCAIAQTWLRALSNHDLPARVRAHKLMLFKKAWEKLEEAQPGSVPASLSAE